MVEPRIMGYNLNQQQHKFHSLDKLLVRNNIIACNFDFIFKQNYHNLFLHLKENHVTDVLFRISKAKQYAYFMKRINENHYSNIS